MLVLPNNIQLHLASVPSPLFNLDVPKCWRIDLLSFEEAHNGWPRAKRPSEAQGGANAVHNTVDMDALLSSLLT